MVFVQKSNSATQGCYSFRVNCPLLVAASIAVVGPDIGPGLTAASTVPGWSKSAKSLLEVTYWTSRHLPEFLFTMVAPTMSHF